MINPLKKLNIRWSIGTQLYLSIAVFVLLIFLAGFLGWKTMREMNIIQKTITQKYIPELFLAIKMGQESMALMNSAPKLLAAQNEETIDSISSLNKKNIENLSSILQQIKTTHSDKAAFSKYESYSQELINNLNLLEKSVALTLNLKLKLDSLLSESLSKAYAVNRALISEVDDQTFFLQTGWKSLDQTRPVPLAKRAGKRFLNHYRSLLNLKAQGQQASGLLNQAVQLSDPNLIQPLRERFKAAMGSCKQSLLLMANTPFRNKLFKQIQDIERVGLGTQSGNSKGLFHLLEQIFKQQQLQEKYLSSNRNTVKNFSDQTEQLIGNIKKIGNETTSLFEHTLAKNKVQLTILSIFSLILAFCTTFFLIGRFFVSRVRHLSQTILTMSKGNLEVPLKLRGNDEITDIAKAMEVFRRYALDVQKLNLVQKLAKEVQEKNDKLEGTIAQLKTAQKQIIMQEKLASLGQLTSGIAHEIKNPLNFINNFSSVSKELLEELSRELVLPENELSKESKGLVEDVLRDLHGNMDKINTHGKRANDIITGMLQHSRSKSKSINERILLNPFINSCVNLAYQGKRAAGSTFNVDFKKNYSKEFQEIDINPQDISRVVLNLITNACDALEEKQKILSEEEQESFSPTIWVTTRKNDHHLEIVVEDNGSGIPDENVDKIFDPFFTTKSTDKGTGLGLSLSHDIILKHGGNLKAGRSKEGGAEFVIQLPFSPQSTTEESDDDLDIPHKPQESTSEESISP